MATGGKGTRLEASNLPPVTLLPHGISDLDESSNVSARQQAGKDAARQVLPRPLGASGFANLQVALEHCQIHSGRQDIAAFDDAAAIDV